MLPETEVHPVLNGIVTLVTCPGVMLKEVDQEVLGFVMVTEQARGPDAKACSVTLYCGA